MLIVLITAPYIKKINLEEAERLKEFRNFEIQRRDLDWLAFDLSYKVCLRKNNFNSFLKLIFR